MATVVLISATSAVHGSAARAADPPKGAVWTEHYFPMGDGVTTLHADVLRPKDAADQRTPVILTVSPYTNHAGSTTDYNPSAYGPNPRFYDFLEVSNIIARGYTYVMVDLPGFGGSSGCNDWGGLREQGAVKAAVEWAASQSWSTGRVGLLGKSYDGWTGLMGMAQKPKGLAAVVSMEPVFSGYRYLYNNGVRFFNSVATPAAFQLYDAKPGSLRDTPQYLANGAPQAWCYGVNMALQQQDEESSEFWKERNLLLHARRSRVPLFLTQGFLESNTKPDAAFDFFNALDGENRAWFGQFGHWRGWERSSNEKYLLGRSVFAAEMMRFFDQHVKGVDTSVEKDPPVAVQDIRGRYREEAQWPPTDMRMYESNLRGGTYRDDGENNGTGRGAGNGIWSISQPLPHDAWLAGEPVVRVTVNALPRSNLVANVYDIDPRGNALMVSRGALLLRGAGRQDATFELYGQDWPMKEGHRIGVVLSSSNSDWWMHIPTGSEVSVVEASISLPFLTYERTRFLEGTTPPDLKSFYRSGFDVSKETISGSTTRFVIPGPLRKLKR